MNKQQASLLLMNKVIVPQTDTLFPVGVEHVATFSANLMSIGFVLSDEVISECAKNLTEADFERWSNNLREHLIKYNGARENMKPMYPDFPLQVMNASETELFMNALVHYISNGKWLPEYEDKIKLRTSSIVVPKVIGLTNENELISYAAKLANMPVAMSQQQRDIFNFLIEDYIARIYIRDDFSMSNKENIAFVIHSISKLNTNLSYVFRNLLTKENINTITDVLRLAIAFLEGDVSLSEQTKLKSIKRSDRRFLLSIINELYKSNCNQVLEDAARHQNLWKIVLKQLHPGDYKTKYVHAYQFATKVREDKLRTWYSKLEKAYNDKDISKIILMLKKRPGEFARRLERTIRLVKDEREAIAIIQNFAEVADKVDNTILLQLMAYFENKTSNIIHENKMNIRTFFPKGQMSKIYVIEDDREQLSPLLYVMCKSACLNALLSKYSTREKLGKVYIDSKILDFTVPLKLRNASNQLHTISRGSKMKLPENTNILRLYIWWKNIVKNSYETSVDIDLSATFYDENFEKAMKEISYYNMREDGCCHSGDIVTAPNGAAEFINIDIDNLLQKGVRYVSMVINSYSYDNFCDLPECFAGVMAIDKIEDREPTFDPAKSFVRSDISTASTACIPMVFDLVTKEVIWVDSVIPNNSFVNNVAYCKDAITSLVRGIICSSYPTLDDLIILNTIARGGRIVDNKEDADIIFSLDEGITPFDLEILNSEWV